MDLLQQLQQIPPNPEPDSLDAAAAVLAVLRAHARSTNFAVRTAKQTSADTRAAMDATHLMLQNLLYERRHLEREIEKCNQFASIYQDVPLHSLEEFLQLAPDEAKDESVLQNDHQLMLNRLSFELAERHRLEERRRSLLAAKDSKMKEYRDNEKLVNEWFSNGTGVERAISDLSRMGTNVSSKLGIRTVSSTIPHSREPSPFPPNGDRSSPSTTANSNLMVVDPPSAPASLRVPTPTPPTGPASMQGLPTGPRIRQ